MIVALLNQKGGVGKTTLALHLAGQWARQGERVTLIDADLLELDSLWAAAGHPHAVFNLTARELIALTGAPVVDVALRETA